MYYLLFVGLALSVVGSLWSLSWRACSRCSAASDLLAWPLAPIGVAAYLTLPLALFDPDLLSLVALAVSAAFGVHLALVWQLHRHRLACPACLLTAGGAALASISLLLAGELSAPQGLAVVGVAAALSHGVLSARVRSLRRVRAVARAALEREIAAEPRPSPGSARLVAYHRAGCPACQHLLAEVLPDLRRTYEDRLQVDLRPAPTELVAPTVVVVGAQTTWFEGAPELDLLSYALDSAFATFDDLSRRLAEQRLLLDAALARADLPAVLELSEDMGDLAFRLGDGTLAAAAFGQAISAAAKLGQDALHLEVARAGSALRAGLLDEAERGFARLLSLLDDESVRAEIYAALALVAGRRGDRSEARARLNDARAASASAAADVRGRVARGAAETWLQIGERSRAREAASTALALLDTDPEAIPPEDRFALHTLAAELLDGPEGTRQLELALRHAPAALGDSNSWWEIRRCLRVLDHAPELPRDPAMEEGVTRLRHAAALRVG